LYKPFLLQGVVSLKYVAVLILMDELNPPFTTSYTSDNNFSNGIGLKPPRRELLHIPWRIAENAGGMVND
jgi:hypothetical protein